MGRLLIILASLIATRGVGRGFGRPRQRRRGEMTAAGTATFPLSSHFRARLACRKPAKGGLVPSRKDADELNEPWFRREMKAIGAVLDKWLNRDIPGRNRRFGFALVVFPFGKNKARCTYVSNGAKRKEVVAMLRRGGTRTAQRAALKEPRSSTSVTPAIATRARLGSQKR
jgi:hypothetical protein